MNFIVQGRRQAGAGKENGVAEVEALSPEDGRMAGDEDEHVAGLGDDVALIFDGVFNRMISSAVASGRPTWW